VADVIGADQPFAALLSDDESASASMAGCPAVSRSYRWKQLVALLGDSVQRHLGFVSHGARDSGNAV